MEIYDLSLREDEGRWNMKSRDNLTLMKEDKGPRMIHIGSRTRPWPLFRCLIVFPLSVSSFYIYLLNVER